MRLQRVHEHFIGVSNDSKSILHSYESSDIFQSGIIQLVSDLHAVIDLFRKANKFLFLAHVLFCNNIV